MARGTMATEIERWRAIVAEETARLEKLDPHGVRLSRADLERYSRRLADLLSTAEAR